MACLAGAPRAAWTTSHAFFERLENARERLPVFQGELYLEYHRATFTTQSEHKRLYRACETALQAHEAARVVCGAGPLGEDAWLRVLFAQFHDALPGSSIGLVYEQLNAELAAIARRELDAATTELSTADDGDAYVAFNPLPVPRAAVVDAPGRGPELVHLPALGGALLRGADDAAEVTAHPSARLLDNGIVRAGFDERGQLASLTVDGEPLELNGACRFELYHDFPANFDAWDIDHYTFKSGVPIATDVRLEVAETGPSRAVLRGTTEIGAASRLTVDYILEAGSRHLRVDAHLDWHESHRLLKFHVPTRYNGRWARYGCPFGAIDRPQQPGREVDEAMWEVPGSRWAAVTRDDGSGLAILTEAKYGFACRDGDLSVSLLRAPTVPDERADRGRHHIRFAIGRYESRSCGDLLNTAAAADALFAPVIVARRAADIPPPFAWLDLGSLTPVWVTPSETGSGYVLRMHETAGGAGVARLRLHREPGCVHLVDFLERELGELQPDDGSDYTIPYGPYQVVSILVR
jgi:alpha-mannosidase